MDKEVWENALQEIFTTIFLDQLHKEFKNTEKEVAHVNQYLHSSSKPEHLREVRNVDRFRESLHMTKDEARSIAKRCGSDLKQVTLEMARSFATKAYNQTTGARTFEAGSDVTTVLDWSERHSLKNEEVPSRSATQDATPRNRKFLQNYIPPNLSYKETENHKILKKDILEQKYKVWHVFGMSGTGKSQMVRGICAEIDKEEEGYVIWHVQCPQKEETLMKSIGMLLSRLREYYPEQNFSDVDNDGKTKHFVDGLAGMPFKSLLVFEDSENERDKGLVRDLITNIFSGNTDTANLQLIFVTQQMDMFFLNGKPCEDADYKLFPVSGFTEEEAVSFLCDARTHVSDSVIQLASELSYSPLRLYIAREFCRKYDFSYESYYNSLGKNEMIIEIEKRLLEQHPNLGKHTYEVVTKMLEPMNEDETSQQYVVKMMSFLDNVSIPGALLRNFLQESCSHLDSTSIENKSLQLKVLLQRLETQFCASVYHIADDYVIISTIHKDILTAVRFSMSMVERRQSIVKVLKSMLSLIGKDNRVRRSNTLLADMKNHLNLVFEFAEDLLGADLETDNSSDNLDILFYLSRLCEVIGFATSQLTSSTDDSWFEKATKYLVKISSHTLRGFVSDISCSIDDIESGLSFAETKDPKDTAIMLFEAFQTASQKISADWIQELNERFSPLTMAYIRDMKKRWPGLQWNDIESGVRSMTPLSRQQYETLQQTGAVVHPSTMHKICLVEYLASILHSRGRQMFYLKKTIKSEDRKRYEWFTDVGFSLCQLIRERTGVRSIFEYIIQANNILHRLLVAPTNDESDEDFMQRLNEARTMAKLLLNVDGDFYEHGKYKMVPGGPFTKMNALNIIVKANTKIHKHRHLVQFFRNGEESYYCYQLCEVGKQFADKFSFASNCLINVARYYGATGEYSMAMEAIEMGFNTNHIGINNQRDIKVETCVWALYNSGRALYASQGNMENFRNHCDKFFHRYRYLKRHKSQDIPIWWHEEIDDMNTRLESLYDKA